MTNKVDHGERENGVDMSELVVIVREVRRCFPDLKVDDVSMLMVAIQLQRNAILNDTAIISGNIADGLADLATASRLTGEDIKWN